jgi:hypothetical protein
MSVLIVTILFIFGVLVAVISADFALNRRKSWRWLLMPSVYCLLVDLVSTWISDRKVDIAAIAFFSVMLTVIGWAIVKFELRRH